MYSDIGLILLHTFIYNSLGFMLYLLPARCIPNLQPQLLRSTSIDSLYTCVPDPSTPPFRGGYAPFMQS